MDNAPISVPQQWVRDRRQVCDHMTRQRHSPRVSSRGPPLEHPAQRTARMVPLLLTRIASASAASTWCADTGASASACAPSRATSASAQSPAPMKKNLLTGSVNKATGRSRGDRNTRHTAGHRAASSICRQRWTVVLAAGCRRDRRLRPHSSTPPPERLQVVQRLELIQEQPAMGPAAELKRLKQHMSVQCISLWLEGWCSHCVQPRQQ